jgi:hypothetical protein
VPHAITGGAPERRRRRGIEPAAVLLAPPPPARFRSSPFVLVPGEHTTLTLSPSSSDSTSRSNLQAPNTGDLVSQDPPRTSVLMLTVKFRQPSHEFTFGVGMTFVSYPLVLTPVV